MIGALSETAVMPGGERARLILAARCGACWARPDWPCDLTVPGETERIEVLPGYSVQVHAARAGRAARKGMPAGPVPDPVPSPHEDPSLPHQIVLVFNRAHFTQGVAVSCNCLRTSPGTGRGCPRRLIESRPVFPAAEAVAAYRTWHEQNGILL